jgi:DNA adenine methylase
MIKTNTHSSSLRRTVFRWIGSKWRIMPQLVPLISDHRCYVSVFGGAASDIARKPRSRLEVYNDLNADLFNVFSVLRQEPLRKKLCVQLRYSPPSRRHFNDCLSLLHSTNGKPFERAFAFLYATAYSYGGKDPGVATPGAFCPKNVSPSRRWEAVAEHMEAVGRRFFNVLLENRPWQEVLDRYDAADVLFYIDPPYVPSTRVSPNIYRHDMETGEHVELASRLLSLKAKVMLSGYHNPIYAPFLADWRTAEIETYCSIALAKKKPRRTEVVWMNYDKDGRRLAG